MERDDRSIEHVASTHDIDLEEKHNPRRQSRRFENRGRKVT
jgi:hypothetical protein